MRVRTLQHPQPVLRVRVSTNYSGDQQRLRNRKNAAHGPGPTCGAINVETPRRVWFDAQIEPLPVFLLLCVDTAVRAVKPRWYRDGGIHTVTARGGGEPTLTAT